MKKLSLMLALMAAAMLPVTAVAQDTTKSKSSKKKSKASKADAGNKAEADDGSAKAAEGVSFTDEQILLNNRAAEATKKGDFKQAEQLYNALLQIGESNIVWFNLGHSQAKQDKCIEARSSFEHVADAPKILEYFTPEEINERTEKAMRELSEKCSATIRVSCNPQEMEISIDGGDPIKCSETEYSVVPGKHSIMGRTEKGFNTIVVDATANMLTVAPIEVIDYEAIVDKAGITPEELQKKSTLFKALGYTFIGVGAATAATGGIMDYYFWNKYKNDLNKVNNQEGSSSNTNKIKQEQSDYYNYIYVGYALIGVGSAMAITGVILVVYDAFSIQPQLEELSRGKTAFAPMFAPVVSPQFTGFTLSATF